MPCSQRTSRFALMALVCFAVQFMENPSAAPAAQPGPIGMIGAAKIDITPDCPVRLYGYAIRTTESIGIGGRLKASALAVGGDEGDGPAVLLSVDSGSVPKEIREEVFRRLEAKSALKPERFMLCNTHIHSGPNLRWQQGIEGQESEHLARYAKDLTDKLEQVVLQALAARKPGRLDWTRGAVGFAVNRRVLKGGKWVNFGITPEGPADHSVPVLRATDAEGKLVAVVLNYACHSTTLGEYYHKIHADWGGCAQEYIEAEHPGAIAIVTLGCGADANPYPRHEKGGDDFYCNLHGQAMADEVNRLLAGPMKPVEPLVVARATTLEIPYENNLPIDQLREKAKESSSAKRLLARIEKGDKLPEAERYPLAVWTFGDDLAMVFLSNEVVVDYALRLKREFDRDRLWINAYAYEVSYYVPSTRLLAEGGYEANNSLGAMVTFGRPETMQPPLEERIIGGVRSLMPEAFGKP